MKQRAAWLAAAAAVGVLALWLWLTPSAPEVTPLLSQQAARPSAGQQPAIPPAPAARPSAGIVAAAASAASSAAPQDTWQALKAWLGLSDREPVVLDLCGIGRMPISKPPPGQGEGVDLLPPHLGSEAQAQALQMLLARLDNGPPRWRAAAALMRGADGTGQTSAAALRALAQQSDDPVVVVLALQACKADEACRSDIARRWLQLEPDNLAAIQEAQDPRTPPDTTLLPRLAQARVYRLHSGALMKVVMEATANDPPSYLQPGLWIHATGVEAAFGVSPFKELVGRCPDNMAADHPNKALCAAVAKTLVEHSDTVLGHMIGLRLAERTFMTKPESEQRRAALNALMLPDLTAWLDPMPTSCANVERFRALFSRRAQLGELAALRAKTN